MAIEEPKRGEGSEYRGTPERRGAPEPTESSLPSNGELASALRTIADYLAVEGESPYRIRAYQNAAEAFRDYPASLAAMAREGHLQDLSGVGEAIQEKITEYLEKGTIAYLEEQRDRYPGDILALTRLPGVGPKTVKKLWEELGISSLDELRTAAEQGTIRDLPGMGSKSEENILEALSAKEAQSERYLLGEIEPLADRLLANLRGLEGVSRAEHAGSLRRRRSTVHDIDLAAATTDPETTARGFSQLKEMARISERGETKVVARTQSGIGVDLRLSEPASFGNMLQHLTGSAEHNVALRGYAQDRGISVSEYALLEEQSGRRYSYETEEEVYRHLGMPYIPPELREAQGELEAAREGRLPRLVCREDLRGDLHVHSDWSDGRAPMQEMIRAARAYGLEYVCFSDHTQSLGVVGGLTPEQLRRQAAEIHSLDADLQDITLLAGSEVDILAGGSLDLPDAVLEELDFVTASIHSGLRGSEAEIMERLEGALRHPHVHAIGHLTGRLLGRRDPYPLDIDRVAELAAETGTFLEINASYERLDLSAPHIRRARQSGARMIICSDAHSPAGFDTLRYGVGEARRGWLEAGDVANTLPWEELTSILQG